MFRQYVKGNKVINATEKAFNVIYKSLGYKEATKQPTKRDNEASNAKGCDDMTKAGIIEILAYRGIEHNPRDTKQELYDLLLGSE